MPPGGNQGEEMKILHVSESIQGGSATYFNEVLPSQIDALGPDRVRMIVPDRHVAYLRGMPHGSVVPFRRPRRAGGLSDLTRVVMREVKTWRPDIIHAHSTFAGGIVRGLSLVRSGFPPVVYCPHGWVFDMDTLGRLKRPAQWTERLLAGFCRRVIAISRYEYDQGLRIGIPASHMTIIENGIAATGPQPVVATWNDDRIRVLFIGRIERQKGVDILLDAVRGLGSRVSVRIIGATVNGDGDFMRDMPGNVEFVGWQSPEEIAGHLAVCDVVAMPSRWEGFGLVAVEAMRAGRPVIASAVGGLQSIVVDGETGFVVPTENSAALARALVARDAAGWAAMGLAGHERFLQRYTSDRTAAQLMQLYHGVLEDVTVRSHQPA